MSEPVIQATDLVKNFPVASKKLGEKPKTLHAVGGVTLTVNKGEIFGVVGESGCGKSTLGRCLLRLETITDGTVCFQGKDITRLSGEALKPLQVVGMVLVITGSLSTEISWGSFLRRRRAPR